MTTPVTHSGGGIRVTAIPRDPVDIDGLASALIDLAREKPKTDKLRPETKKKDTRPLTKIISEKRTLERRQRWDEKRRQVRQERQNTLDQYHVQLALMENLMAKHRDHFEQLDPPERDALEKYLFAGQRIDVGPLLSYRLGLLKADPTLQERAEAALEKLHQKVDKAKKKQ